MVNGQSPFGTPPTTSDVSDTHSVATAQRVPARQHDTVQVMLVPPPGRTRAAKRPVKRPARGRKTLVTSFIVILSLAAGVAGGWFLMGDDISSAAQSPPAGETQPSQTDAIAKRLSSRDTDTAPIHHTQLFDDLKLTARDNSYRLLRTHTLTNCASAATKEMAPLLREGDCTQAVRATITDAPGQHAATLGVVNLAEDSDATRLRADLEDGDAGAFNTLPAGGASSELGLHPTVLGYNTYGHYLMYVVIGRVDGASPARQDSRVKTIVADLVDNYLVDELTYRTA